MILKVVSEKQTPLRETSINEGKSERKSTVVSNRTE